MAAAARSWGGCLGGGSAGRLCLHKVVQAVDTSPESWEREEDLSISTHGFQRGQNHSLPRLEKKPPILLSGILGFPAKNCSLQAHNDVNGVE